SGMKRTILAACIVLSAVGCGAGDSASTSAWEALPLGTKADFRAIWFADAQHGWIAGGSYEITGGLVGRTSDGGKTWQYVSNLSERDGVTAQSIHFFDADRGILAASSGSIFSTADGGQTWTIVDRRGRVSGLSAMFVLDGGRGWAAGTGDVIVT